MYANDDLVLELLALLKSHGVKDVVVSPGSRHYAFTRSLESDADFNLYSVVDERSAAFFALGLIQASGRPAAVICTSGSASLNYATAVSEAYYQGLPLVVLTADRLPEFLGQSEDQMLDQSGIYDGFVKFSGQLRPINSTRDKWYCNRTVNEALLVAVEGGPGPVHLNIPIESHTNVRFETRRLPAARVIRRHTPLDLIREAEGFQQRLQGKRIVVAHGQSPRPSPTEMNALERFLSTYDAICITDNLGNLPSTLAATRTMMLLRTPSARETIGSADLVITTGGNASYLDELKSLLRAKQTEHWRIDPEGRISDPFWSLTDVFTSESDSFFEALSETGPSSPPNRGFAERIQSIDSKLPTPNFETYGETAAIGHLLQQIPAGSALHIANSAPIRMAQLFLIDDSIDVYCNRGVNGIDGCMSSAIGYAAATQRETFLIIGDLTFFYDMNSLAIRHLPPNLRIMVINNGGGAVMHSPLPADYSKKAGRFVSAEHGLRVEGWATSLGISYGSAHDSVSLAEGVRWLTNGPLSDMRLLEVATDRLDDIGQLKSFYAMLSDSEIGMTRYRQFRKHIGRLLRRLGLLR